MSASPAAATAASHAHAPTAREQALAAQLAAVQAQLDAAQRQLRARAGPGAAAPSSSSSSSSAASQPMMDSKAMESMLMDLVGRPQVPPSELAAFLQRHSIPSHACKRVARLCYEHLLDDPVRPATLPTTLQKLVVLPCHGLMCPLEVFRPFRRVEAIETGCTALGQEAFGEFFAAVYRAIAPDERPALADLFDKLDGADLLLLAYELARRHVLSIGVNRPLVCLIVHLARHGPVRRLQAELAELPERKRLLTVNGHHNAFPVLFQPLIELEKGWLRRLRVLLEAGAEADAVYAPWNASALHMLFYRKARDRNLLKEAKLMEAVQLLLGRGAKTVLDLRDKGGRSQVHGRTALVQAASDGRYQVCCQLLGVGADADVLDNQGHSLLEVLFYLKHSAYKAHQRASEGYQCIDLYHMVNRFHLEHLVTDELRHDAQDCRQCKYLLATVRAEGESSNSGSEDGESENSARSMSVSKGEEEQAAEERKQESDSEPMTAGKTNQSDMLHRAMARMRL